MPAKVTVGKIHFGRSKFDTLYKGKKSWKMVLLENKKTQSTLQTKNNLIFYIIYMYSTTISVF